MNHPETTPAAPRRPLAISLLLGISGWAAGGLTLLLVSMLFYPDTPSQAAISGALLLAAAWGLFKADQDDGHAFVAQLALALSMAGQCLVLFAMAKDAQGIVQISGAALLLQTVMALVMPNRLHRTLSTFFALIAWALTLRFALFATPHSTSLPAALTAWVLVWGPVAAALYLAIRREPLWAGRSWAPAVRSVTTGLIGGLAFATLASYPFESFSRFGEPAAVVVDHLSLWPLLSALGALGALTAAFALRQRGLTALCGVAALLHISHFYYALGTSLLTKSLVMLTMGGICLAGAHALRTKEPS
jgi:Domain of unknown function (DUF4401)